MKYFAIFKDSLREAIDTKVFYVMVALSVLLILFLLTNRFAPQPAPEFFGPIVQNFAPGMQDIEEKRAQRVQAQAEVRDQDGKVVEQDMAKQIQEFARFEWLHFEVADVQPVNGPIDSPDTTFKVKVRAQTGSEAALMAAQLFPDRVVGVLSKRLKKAEELEICRASNIRMLPITKAAGNDDKFRPHVIELEFTSEPLRNTRRLWPTQFQMAFGALPVGGNAPLGIQLYLFGMIIFRIGGWVTLIISVVMTAFFIPNMLRKGTVDLLIVKPIHRPVLLIYKYLGGLTFIFLNTAVAIGGVWLALGLKSGVWANYFLLMIPTLTFFFAILYAVSTLFGVISRSPIVAILVTCLAWFLFFAAGTAYTVVDSRAHEETRRNMPADQRWSDNAVCTGIKVVHFVTPRTSDLNVLASIMLAQDFLSDEVVKSVREDETSITWGESISVSLAFIILMLAASCWWFHATDY
jgi:ABC-type transport system involved in multi-copper enzyme maturation permease subunit